MKAQILLFSIALLMASCQSGEAPAHTVKEQSSSEAKPAKVFSAEATAVFAKALKAHGGERYKQAHFQFVFRNKTYTFQNDGPAFRYGVMSRKKDTTTVDVLDNGVLMRRINGEAVSLTEKQTKAATEHLNSVIYFATLPHKLTDASVNLAFGGQVAIKDTIYDILHVTFDQEGGGVDHDDQFRYWIHTESGRIDYLAYNYLTNGGGIRFREAYNPRIIDGILFQDYVNYKAPVGTALDSLPQLFMRGELEQLSLIETEEVVAL